jgi:hypothetical protein
VLVDVLVEEVPLLFGQPAPEWPVVPLFAELLSVDCVVVVVVDELGVGVGSTALTMATPPTPSRPIASTALAARRLAAGKRGWRWSRWSPSGRPGATWMMGIS